MPVMSFLRFLMLLSLVVWIGGLIFFIHAVATLIVLSAPAVAEAFRRGRSHT